MDQASTLRIRAHTYSFMVKNPITSDKDLDLKEAHKLMKEQKVGKLILVNEKGELRGMYCFKDVDLIMRGDLDSINRDNRGRLRVGANIGVGGFERAEKLLEAKCDVLLVGTAHGHSKNVIDTVAETVREIKPKLNPKIWKNENKIKPDVRKQLTRKADRLGCRQAYDRGFGRL